MDSINKAKDLQPGATGVYLIDKPSGMTSHDVVNWARRQTGQKRVGHAGTLDPLASGLLIILVGREFTKQQSKFLKQDKTYTCTARLGIETDSYDIDGQVISQTPWDKVADTTKQDLESVLSKFRGKITQTVPAYSAVKVQGKKLYELARDRNKDTNNILSKLPSREVDIKKLKLEEFSVDEAKQKSFFTVTVECSSGTYIRSLIHDIGSELRAGATVTQLRREKIGIYSVKKALNISNI